MIIIIIIHEIDAQLREIVSYFHIFSFFHSFFNSNLFFGLAMLAMRFAVFDIY